FRSTGTVDNGFKLAFNRSDTLTVSNAISGGGFVSQDGSGTTILTGNNSYGFTAINAGTLQVGNGGTTGTLGTIGVTNNAILAFNRSDTVTVANAISGTGSLANSGSGTTILTGSNTYTGATTVNAGILALNGSVASAITVNAGGTLRGSGTAGGGVTVNGT